MDDKAPYVVFYVLAGLFVATSLIGRRIPLGKAARMALAWIAIFGVIFVLFAFRNEISSLGQRLKAEATGSAIVAGETVRIPISDDGHYWVDAKVNGHEIRFMVDSGASVTTISSDKARAAGIEASAKRAIVNTANGPVLVAQGYAERLQVGSIERTDFPVDINDRDGLNLLGMNFLSSLSSWRVEGNYLVLAP